MRNLLLVLGVFAGLAVPSFVLVGCGGDDDDDAVGDGDADSDADGDSDGDADGDSDADGDADGDGDADCEAACDHIETCEFPDFNRVTCVANCQCNVQGVIRPELVGDLVACSETTACVDDWSAQCVAGLEYEPTAAAATFVTDCTARVQALCPKEAADYDCSVFGPVTDESAAAFTPCLEEATCADALDCITTAALGICTG